MCLLSDHIRGVQQNKKMAILSTGAQSTTCSTSHEVKKHNRRKLYSVNSTKCCLYVSAAVLSQAASLCVVNRGTECFFSTSQHLRVIFEIGQGHIEPMLCCNSPECSLFLLKLQYVVLYFYGAIWW